MAIEGISSAVSGYSVRSTQPSADITVASTAASSQIKVENAISATEAKGENKFNDRKQGENPKDEDKAAVQTDGEIPTDKIKSAVDDINKRLSMRHTNCSFKYHEKTNRISITVKDSDTDEVIREIPPEKALDMLAKVWELAGLMVDEKR